MHSPVKIVAMSSSTFDFDDVFDWPDKSRRFTASEKALLKAVDLIERETPNIWQAFVKESCNWVVNSSLYGEVQSIADVAENIAAGQYLVSPISFQNSVANATPASICRLKNIDFPYSARVGDWLAVDETAHQYWYRLRSSKPQAVLFSHCEESIGFHEGRAEVYIMANEAWLCTNEIASDPEQTVSFFPETALNDNELAAICDIPVRHYLEAESESPWLALKNMPKAFRRSAGTARGRELNTYFFREK